MRSSLPLNNQVELHKGEFLTDFSQLHSQTAELRSKTFPKAYTRDSQRSQATENLRFSVEVLQCTSLTGLLQGAIHGQLDIILNSRFEPRQARPLTRGLRELCL